MDAQQARGGGELNKPARYLNGSGVYRVGYPGHEKGFIKY